jgi:hypothetical protein
MINDKTILSMLLLLLSGALIFTLILPDNIISFALVGLTIIATLWQLKKTNLKL